ncbi:hypothetical protein BDR22DRAFT_971982 [Usnea florida]
MNTQQSTTATDKLRPGGVAIVVICIIFIIPATLAVILRVWARRIQRVHLVWNDYLIIAALFFAVTETVVLFLGTSSTTTAEISNSYLFHAAVTEGKVGYHLTDLTPSEATAVVKAYYAAEPLWVSANTCVKLSILHLYKQLFPIRKFRIMVYAVMLLVVGFWTSTIVRMFFLCSPLAFYWDKSIKGGTCLNNYATSLSVSIINLILDLIVVALPMPMLWGLQVTTSKKIGLTTVFGIGGVLVFLCAVLETSWARANDGDVYRICIITVLRIVSVANLDLNDISYSGIDDAILSELEPCLGIINACLPVIPPVVSQVFRPAISKWRIWSRSGSTAQNTHEGPPFARQSLRPSDSEAANFRHLEEDVYPLTDMSFGGPNRVDGVAHG